MFPDDDTAPFFPDKNTQESSTHKQHIQKTNQSKKIVSLTNLPFVYFIIGAILSIVCSILYIINNSIGFIVSGIIGIIICTFAIKHFMTLINLKIEIDSFSKLNSQFKKQHIETKKAIDTLSSANEHLLDTHNRLQLSNKKNRDNLLIFRGIQYNMEQFNAQTVEELTNVLSKVVNLEQRWHEELYKQERRMLYIVFDRFCSYQNHIGMDENEFKQFINELPVSYQDRIGRLGTFKKLAGNESIILLEDFANTLDIFAEMETCDIDIEFELQPTKTKRKSDPRQRLRQRKTQYFSNKQKTLILQSIAEDEMMKEEKKFIDINVDDDRKYDNALLKYESQIIITKRSTPKHKISHSIIPSLTVMTPTQSTVDRWLEKETSTPMSPLLYDGPINPYYRANLFKHNKLITDISVQNLNLNETSLVLTPPVPLESMDTGDIEQTNFTDAQMNKYMQNINKIDKTTQY